MKELTVDCTKEEYIEWYESLTTEQKQKAAYILKTFTGKPSESGD